MTRREKMVRSNTLQSELKDLVRPIMQLKDLDRMKYIANLDLNDITSKVDEMNNITKTLNPTAGEKRRFSVFMKDTEVVIEYLKSEKRCINEAVSKVYGIPGNVKFIGW